MVLHDHLLPSTRLRRLATNSNGHISDELLLIRWSSSTADNRLVTTSHVRIGAFVARGLKHQRDQENIHQPWHA